MEEKLKQLKSIQAELSDLAQTAGLLSWDQQVNMPPGGAEARSNQMATLQRLIHTKIISPEVGPLLDDLVNAAKDLDPDSDESRLIKVSKRDYDQAAKVPPEFTAKRAKLTTMAHGAWAEAREKNDFSIFQSQLEEIVELTKEFSEFFAPYDHVYDPLLDQFEPGMKTLETKAIFESLRPQQVELIKAISDRHQVDDSFLFQEYDEQKQWSFGVDVITKYGYDWNRGRQDKAVHPFTSNFGRTDVRITTRVYPDYVGSALFSTMHECGHALYELGSSPDYERTALAGASSLAIHESQSRMYENLIGRSLPFWEHFYPKLQDFFPSQLGNIGLEKFYKGINKVAPSLIRVEADEATYNLHIMLRLEIEIALMEGNLAVKDLPTVWNSKMEEYLGVVPPTDTEGVLQDIHWSFGGIGYFSTYALGNIISGQLWDKIHVDIPNINDQIRAGEFGVILEWLVEKIHKHGSKYDPQELVERVTGSRIDPAPYMRYLTKKYSEIYGI